jgi:hypothetical protein
MARLLALLLLASPARADWVQPGEFAGRRILLAVYYWGGGEPMAYVPKVLRELGFAVDILREPQHLPDLAELDQYDECWIVSGIGSSFDHTDVEKLRRYLKAGHGVYVMADNTPFTHEANLIAGAFYGVHLAGEYDGERVVNVVPRARMKQIVEVAMQKGDMKKLAELRHAGFLDGKLYAEDHELLSGIQQIYEGHTVAAQTASPDLDVILRDSANERLVSVSTRPGERLVLDGAFTRLYWGWESNAATSTRWYRNVAAWLLGKRRTDLQQASGSPQAR